MITRDELSLAAISCLAFCRARGLEDLEHCLARGLQEGRKGEPKAQHSARLEQDSTTDEERTARWYLFESSSMMLCRK